MHIEVTQRDFLICKNGDKYEVKLHEVLIATTETYKRAAFLISTFLRTLRFIQDIP